MPPVATAAATTPATDVLTRAAGERNLLMLSCLLETKPGWSDPSTEWFAPGRRPSPTSRWPRSHRDVRHSREQHSTASTHKVRHFSQSVDRRALYGSQKGRSTRASAPSRRTLAPPRGGDTGRPALARWGRDRPGDADPRPPGLERRAGGRAARRRDGRGDPVVARGRPRRGARAARVGVRGHAAPALLLPQPGGRSALRRPPLRPRQHRVGGPGGARTWPGRRPGDRRAALPRHRRGRVPGRRRGPRPGPGQPAPRAPRRARPAPRGQPLRGGGPR